MRAAETRPGPHHAESEESLIGAMLLSLGSIREANALGVTGSDYHDRHLGAIHDLIVSTEAAGAGIDPVTVAARSNGQGITPAELRELQAATPASANARQYALVVLDRARQRDQLHLAHEITEALYRGDDADKLVARLALSSTGPTDAHRLIDGRAFLLDAPTGPAPLWGEPGAPLWPAGEELLLVGPQGVGKTMIEGQLVAASIGAWDSVLGFPVAPAEGRTLVIAADRPGQIQESMRRHFRPEHSALLEERLVFWKGPPPRDFGRHPETLLAMARAAGATRVFIDSIKDVAVKLSDDEVGGNFNRAVQLALVEGVDIASMHHQRKGREGTRPKTLEDVYGSTWVTAGAGSVVLLWGNAGDPIVDLIHLKQPAEPVGPLKIEHDHDAAISTVLRGQADPLVMLRNAPGGLMARDVARVLTEKADPTENDIRTARRKLDRLVTKRLAHRRDPEIGGAGGTQPTRYFAIDLIDKGES